MILIILKFEKNILIVIFKKDKDIIYLSIHIPVELYLPGFVLNFLIGIVI